LKRRDILEFLFFNSRFLTPKLRTGTSEVHLPNKYYVDTRTIGLSSDSKDNSHALRTSIAESEKSGLPILIPASIKPYTILGDITLKSSGAALIGTGGDAHLKFVDGGLRIVAESSHSRNIQIRDISVSRVGVSGAAISVVAIKKASPIRFTWTNIHIHESSGDGLLLEGPYLGTISGLWITKCKESGISIAPNTVGNNSKSASVNSISIFGGEVQNNEWGISAAGSKNFTLTGFAIQGNRSGGVWLKGKNRLFSINGGYFENNAKSFGGQRSSIREHCDIRIGDRDWQSSQNSNIDISNCFFSDGRDQHRSAVWIESQQENIYFHQPFFWGYSGSPIALANPSHNTSTGTIVNAVAERPDGKKIRIINEKYSNFKVQSQNKDLRPNTDF